MEGDEKGSFLKLYNNSVIVLVIFLCLYIGLLNWIAMRTGVNILILFIVGCIPFFGQFMILIWLAWAIFSPVTPLPRPRSRKRQYGNPPPEMYYY